MGYFLHVRDGLLRVSPHGRVVVLSSSPAVAPPVPKMRKSRGGLWATHGFGFRVDRVWALGPAFRFGIKLWVLVYSQNIWARFWVGVLCRDTSLGLGLAVIFITTV